MCDSSVVQSESAFGLDVSISKISHTGASCYNADSHLETVAELYIDNSSAEVWNSGEEADNPGSSTRSSDSSPYRIQLEQDVQRLQEKLQEEMVLHVSLENAIKKNTMKLSSPSCFSHEAQELLSNIALLETTVSKLEQEMVSLHFQLSQERNERRLAEYRLRHSSSPTLSGCFPDITETLYADDSVVLSHEKKISTKTGFKSSQPVEFRKVPTGMSSKGLWNNPNQLSEEMVRCMKNIFMSLADSALPAKSSALESQCSTLSPRGHLSNSSWWSSSDCSMIQSPQIDMQNNSGVLASENVFDPYRVRGKLSWADIGNYGLAMEVSWMSVGKQQLEYASGALKTFRTLVEQLAKVNPVHLSSNEKLAFWINLYNALIMHAYLAYGVPRNDLKLFSLMQKAAYTVGGHSYNAAAIEYMILKMKPPLHRPQIALLLALQKLKVTEEQRKCAIDEYEPLVAFALICGMYSSPAISIYTAKNVREELQEAQRDFIRASVGFSSKGKLLVPKMLHCFCKGSVDDANLAVWISHYLPPHQAAFVEQCISQRRQSFLGSRNCGILPFDSRFRYLFLPDKIPH
ncbi:hypothetical protein KPL70_024759 [Citrus sinensis]|uniref:uncharacterized protein LOC102622713 isoform X2 n=1 Tax=Citrus sinensis TaxID=2711 RepID=UPI00219EA812|nr:uncharacterized protein LOC102622713 isoform X2 [Citrus sinensis]KAH9662171.1 hypothetical protein KPL70_024759 [Citrus sinensis]